MRPAKSYLRRLDEPKPDQARAAWEPPQLRAVGTIAELVQQTKKSGTQDCGGKKRSGTGFGC